MKNQGQPPTELPPIPSGEAREVGWFRAIWKGVRERTVIVGKGLRASYTLNHTLIELDRLSDSGTAVAVFAQRMQIDEVNEDSFSALFEDEDGNPTGNPVEVAKPFALRISSYDGASEATLGSTPFSFDYSGSNARRLSDGTRYFDEVLWPPYQSGDTIYAIKPTGKTGVEFPGLGQLEWLDLNVDARQFRPKMTLVATCQVENGIKVVRYMYVAGGPIQA